MVEAIVKPELLIWARTSAGYDVQAAAKKISVKAEKLMEWESGTKKPTIIQLRKIANVYKRPIAVFYLQEPPSKKQVLLQDFRRVPSAKTNLFSPKLIFEIRKAHFRRQIAVELYESLEGEKPPSIKIKASPGDNPDVVATRIREFLGITIEQQTTFSTDYEALNTWKAAIENKSVLVFQSSGIEVNEMRGFSISSSHFPVIVLNSKDSPLARVFTLLHELVHLITETEGVCDFHDDKGIEVFCNAVAGSILVPYSDFLSNLDAQKAISDSTWSDQEIMNLAGTFRVSRQVLLRRLLSFGYISSDKFNIIQKAYESQAEKSKTKDNNVAIPQHTKAIASSGKLFTQLVLSGYEAERITGPDVSNYLSVKLKHLSEIESVIRG